MVSSEFMWFSSSQSVMKNYYNIYTYIILSWVRWDSWLVVPFTFFFLCCHPEDGMAQLPTSYVFLEICTVWLRGINLSCHLLSYIMKNIRAQRCLAILESWDARWDIKPLNLICLFQGLQSLLDVVSLQWNLCFSWPPCRFWNTSGHRRRPCRGLEPPHRNSFVSRRCR